MPDSGQFLLLRSPKIGCPSADRLSGLSLYLPSDSVSLWPGWSYNTVAAAEKQTSIKLIHHIPTEVRMCDDIL